MACAGRRPGALRRMVQCNLRLVVSVAREYAGRGVPLMDLIQEGNIGLIVAARKFDYTRELRFSTYATKWIRQGITRCLMNHAGLIRVPIHTAERMRAIWRPGRPMCRPTVRSRTWTGWPRRFACPGRRWLSC